MNVSAAENVTPTIASPASSDDRLMLLIMVQSTYNLIRKGTSFPDLTPARRRTIYFPNAEHSSTVLAPRFNHAFNSDRS